MDDRCFGDYWSKFKLSIEEAKRTLIEEAKRTSGGIIEALDDEEDELRSYGRPELRRMTYEAGVFHSSCGLIDMEY